MHESYRRLQQRTEHVLGYMTAGNTKTIYKQMKQIKGGRERKT
jgi:hypothetical protein